MNAIIQLVSAVGLEVVKQLLVRGAEKTEHAQTVRDILGYQTPLDGVLDKLDRDIAKTQAEIARETGEP
jgi:hypothetical protein